MNVNEALKHVKDGTVKTLSISQQKEIAVMFGLDSVVKIDKGITFKVTDKREPGKKADGSPLDAKYRDNDKGSTGGALSVYGLGRNPVTLYRSQWERLIDAVPALIDFIEANKDSLTVK